MRGVATRFTFDPAQDIWPVWSPDDSRIVYCSRGRSGRGRDLYIKPSSGAGKEELLFGSEVIKQATDWSPDGRYIVFQALDPRTKTNWDIWLLSLEDKKAQPIVQTPFQETLGQFSPDGRWLAYLSHESGRPEVYVQPFPGPGGKWQISTGGGGQARWRRDGKEIFYRALDGQLVAVDVKAGAVGQPRPLFNMRTIMTTGIQYDVSPDGQRFLINTAVSDRSAEPITLVLNWMAGLKR